LVFCIFYNMQENLQAFIYKNIKNTSRNPEKLPECHCIGKIMKYPWISPKFTKMPLAARVAHARLLLEARKFSGEISGQKMVASGRSEGEDSDGGGLDGRWWLTRENRRFEASVDDDDRGLFPARWGGENDDNHRGFLYSRGETFLWWCGGWTRPESGDRKRERESPARGERGSGLYYAVNASTVHRCSWSLGSVGSLIKRSCDCDWLDLQVDRTVRMSSGLIWCDAVYQELGTLGDVAPLDLRESCFKGWDWFGF